MQVSSSFSICFFFLVSFSSSSLSSFKKTQREKIETNITKPKLKRLTDEVLAGFFNRNSKALAKCPLAREVPNVERKRILSAYSSATSSLLFCFSFFAIVTESQAIGREKELNRLQGVRAVMEAPMSIEYRAAAVGELGYGVYVGEKLVAFRICHKNWGYLNWLHQELCLGIPLVPGKDSFYIHVRRRDDLEKIVSLAAPYSVGHLTEFDHALRSRVGGESALEVSLERGAHREAPVETGEPLTCSL